jgi:hypothetical protein
LDVHLECELKSLLGQSGNPYDVNFRNIKRKDSF